MPSKRPIITDLTACPHCGCEEFYVMQRYKGVGAYHRRFDGKGGADNTGMYDTLNETVGKTAFCSSCQEPVASWDQDTHNSLYSNR